MSLTMPEDLAQSKRRPEKNNSVGCPLLHKQEVLLSCAIQFDQSLEYLISPTSTNCSNGREGPRAHEGMGAQQQKKVYVRDLFDKKPPGTRQPPLTCMRESKQSVKKNTVCDPFCP